MASSARRSTSWNQGANNLWAAFNASGAPQCEGSSPGGKEPTLPGGSPTTPPGTPPAAAGSGAGSTAVPAPTPPTRKPALKCKKGFQKKTVRGKAKCIKKAKKGKKRR